MGIMGDQRRLCGDIQNDSVLMASTLQHHTPWHKDTVQATSRRKNVKGDRI
jgi:hypothetical protein